MIQIFAIMRDVELKGRSKGLKILPSTCQRRRGGKDDRTSEDKAQDPEDTSMFQTELDALLAEPGETRLDKGIYPADYTQVSRQGKEVKFETKELDDESVLDPKLWDHYSDLGSTGKRYWEKGCGDITEHVVPCFESNRTHSFLTDLFFTHKKSRTCNSEGGCRKRKAAENEETEHCGNCETSNKCSRLDNVENSANLSNSGSKNNFQDSNERLKEKDDNKENEKDDDNVKTIENSESKNHSSPPAIQIKEEPMDVDDRNKLERSASSDSLPPPLLAGPEEGQDGKGGENGEDKAPDLTREDTVILESEEKDKKTEGKAEETKKPEESEVGINI